MPQISKIRIVNFNYNDGNRFIPDELYDLSADSGEALNSLFNLNNGGGKTVLVQLMMQPVNPKAMAGGRRIEDYFVRPGDHSFVLIEWTTDGSKDKLLTGIAMAASISNSSDDNQRGNSIKYYTFKTVYEGFSPYSIASLELSKNENGRYVPAAFDYVRERAKASKGILEYYSSDDSVKWAEELAHYGILRTEWENIIETLNKDEGGLNQYFDDAKTSDKLIAKFFIPAIEQKMKSVAGKGADGSLETMLISYAKKISEKESVIRERDTNRRLLATLAELGDMSDKLYSTNEALLTSIAEACGFKAALAKRITEIEREIENLSQELTTQSELIEHIDYEEKSKAFYLAEDSLARATAVYEIISMQLKKCKEKLADLEHQEDLLQCAKLYKRIIEAEGTIKELKLLIVDRENNSEDADRIARLKYSVFTKAKSKIVEIEDDLSEKLAAIAGNVVELEKAQKVKTKAEAHCGETERRVISAEASLEETKKTSDRLMSKLEIDAIRQFDGFYQEDELENIRNSKERSQRELSAELTQLQSTLDELEKRRDEIPGKKADLAISINETKTKLRGLQEDIAAYDTLYASLLKICNKYSLEETAVFSNRLQSVILEEYDLSQAKLNKCLHEKQVLEERLAAAQNGYVHVLPQIMAYVKDTGISCQTGEEYLVSQVEAGSVSSEELTAILGKYPELAYAILFYTERDLNNFIAAGNIEWLPAIVPLLTMEKVTKIFRNEAETLAYLAAWDREYFSDRTGYCGKLENKIEEMRRRIERYRVLLVEGEEEKRLISSFSYEITWKTDKEREAAELTIKLDEYQKEMARFEAELVQIKEDVASTKEHEALCIDNIKRIESWFDSFVDLLTNLSEEVNSFNKIQALSIEYKSAIAELKKSEEALEALEAMQLDLQREKEELEKTLAGVRDIFSKVSDAKATELIEGEMDVLFSQYTTLYTNMSEDLTKLNEKLDAANKEKTDGETELATYHSCAKTEYAALTFSPDMLERIKKEIEAAKKTLEVCQNQYENCNNDYIKSQTELETATKALAGYTDGAALPRSEIGDDFKNRRTSAKIRIKEIGVRKSVLDKEKQLLDRTADRVSSRLEETGVSENVRLVNISENIEEQWKAINSKLMTCKAAYTAGRDKLSNGIRDAVNEYKGITLAEIVSKLNAVKTILEDAGIRGDRLFTVSESIGTMIASIEKINSQIETDLREIENDFNDIVGQCMNQGKRMYQDLRSIANSSRARIFPGKPQTQMVKMNLPEEDEISEEASRIAIRTELENGTNEICALIKNDADEKEIQKRAKRIVSSQRLLLRYIKQESIQVKVFKIDMNAENSGYKRWEDTLTQSSGAEKFVVFFSVVLTLMNYTRATEGIVSKNTKSVLILDNPFGKITSAHLLKPMFDIAKHFSVQLICLSDINKSDVINCFDCVIKLVIKAQNLSNFEIMTHEGNEKIEHGYYKVMNGQLSLF